jgi:hypothetical protein
MDTFHERFAQLPARTIWIVDAHRDDGKRYVVQADEKLAFRELEFPLAPQNDPAACQSKPYMKIRDRLTCEMRIVRL